MINVIVVDDHELIREGFRKIIDRENDIQLSGEAGSAAELYELIEKVSCDILVLDLKLGTESGLEVLKEIKNRKPQLPVLILSMFSENKFAVRAVKAGAGGYLTKDRAAEELIKAIRQVYNGEKYVTPQLANELIQSLSDSGGEEPHRSLSDREYQVFLKIAEGIQSHTIAEEMNLSKNTVNTYRARILEKMKMKTNTELIKYALKHDLID